MKSRGIKQRLKKRIKKVFGIKEEEVEKEMKEEDGGRKEEWKRQMGGGISKERGKKEGR